MTATATATTAPAMGARTIRLPPSEGSDVGFLVTAEEAGERVDVLVARRAGVSRAVAQEALRDGSVTVGGRAVRPSHRVAEGESIEGEVVAAAAVAPAPEAIPLRIAYSDERVLVVSKPAGLVTHPAAGHRSGTLVNALLALDIPLARAGSPRPGIVHRLDKDTSGLLLVARDDEAHGFLTAALKKRHVARTYLALVRGDLPTGSGTIDAPVGRHPSRRTAMAVLVAGKPAVTHYRVLESGGGVTLLEVTLESGRTHQIRVHLAHLGHPVLGDRAYGGWSERSVALGLQRPFLHAARLAFPHPDDHRTVTVEDPLPEDLAAALASLRPPFRA